MSSSAQRTDMAEKCRSASHAYYVSKLIILRARDRRDLVCRNSFDSFCSNRHNKEPFIRVRNICLRWIRLQEAVVFPSSVIQTAYTLGDTTKPSRKSVRTQVYKEVFFPLIFLLQTQQLPRCEQFCC